MDLLSAQDGPVRILTLNRPAAMNALTGALAADLLAAIRAAEADAATRCVVIAGAGAAAFCAGADLKERRTMSADEKWAQAATLFAVNAAIWTSPKAFIAAIRGWCLGGGFELALACDLRLAAPDARFGFPEMTLGAFPGAGGAVLLPRRIGRTAARPFFYEAKRADAAEAQALGLVDEIAAPDALLAAACARAHRIAQSTSPLGFAGAKQMLNQASDLPFAEAAEMNQALRRPLEASADYAEGLRAHFEKRAPIFTGR
ncbi:enoyl-CoA hydratase/isomerase family protein [Aquabacter spiritensis]|uniref:Short chain enoyl-CoA hydratase n=1 Tax=Aquabacter spiritensis TaxID=933073 RepID=A0A4R3LUS9_9HYPH|nr:enoyl-CoA hydratase-related protein [Aquabacter spiritensis]TCT04360.1 short chain enoyl-CoA hydratase [Aquabacter spiritensis]